MLDPTDDHGASADAAAAAAEARARALVTRYPDRAPPHFGLGLLLERRRAWAEAAESYAEAARLQPDLMMAWLSRATCLRQLGDVAAARGCAGQALALARQQGHKGPAADAAALLAELDDEA